MNKNIYKRTISQLLIPFFLTVLVGVVFTVFMGFTEGQVAAYKYKVGVYLYSTTYLDFLALILFIAPFVWQIFYEKKNRFYDLECMRISSKQLAISKVASILSVVFLAVVASYFISALILINFVPINTISKESTINSKIFIDLIIGKPIFFSFILSLWKGVIMSLIALISIQLSYRIKNILLISTIPFFGILITGFLLGSLNLGAFSYQGFYVFEAIAYDGILNYLIGLFSLILVNFFVYIFMIRRKSYE